MHILEEPSGSSFFLCYVITLPDTLENKFPKVSLMKHIPEITHELIQYLEGICPDASPRLNTGEREVWWNAGKVNLVEHLRSIHNEQNATVLKGD